MNNTNYINLSSQVTLWRDIEVIANNVANLNTTGYKSERMNFKEYIKSLDFSQGSLSFVQTRNVSRNPEQGALNTTGNPLDLALTKDEVFFHIKSPLGDRYTREGRFKLDDSSKLVTVNGLAVLDVNKDEIFIPEDSASITISGDGVIKSDNQEIAQIGVVKFSTPQALSKVGSNLYINLLKEEATYAQQGVLQGALESSNVNAILEMTKLITAHRSFEANDLFIEEEYRRQGKVIEEAGRAVSR